MKQATKPSITILPSVLGADPLKIGADVRAAVEAGAQMIHYDIMDGHFVPGISFGSVISAAAIKAAKDLNPMVESDVHLMVSNPNSAVEDLARTRDKAGVSIEYVTIHIEAGDHQNFNVLLRMRELGFEPGVAISPLTSLSQLEPWYPHVHKVLVMTVQPGAGGQKLHENAVGRVRFVNTEFPKHAQGDQQPLIQVDGGVKVSNIKEVASAGATEIVVGSGFFTDDSPRDLHAVHQALLSAARGD